MTETISWAQARRIALRAQGMGPTRRSAVPAPGRSRLALERTLARTHLLQIDSVSVFARAHHLPVYTRTGSWDPAVLDAAARPGPDRLVREALAHEAAFVTDEVHRLLDFRRRRAATHDWGIVRRAARQSPDLFARIGRTIAEHGPLSAAEVSRRLGDTRRGSGWGWRRTPSQWAVEYLFRAGALDCVGRSAQFERIYVPAHGHEDPERILPPPAEDPSAPAPAAPQAIERLVDLASAALGLADPAAIADYFRLRVGEVRPAIASLVAAGVLEDVEVARPGGRLPMLRHISAPAPTPLSTAALVSPFDPIVFFRPRLRALFDVEYRIGIYTPAAQRTTGYYSLLFLHGDRIPARVDLKADRAAGLLHVRGTFREPLPSVRTRRGLEDETVAGALAGELVRAARWQGLAGIEVETGEGSGQLSAALAARLADASGPVGDAVS